MHEQSTRMQLIDQILDHPVNAERDQHERHELAKSLQSKTVGPLEQILDSLEYDPRTPTPIQ